MDVSNVELSKPFPCPDVATLPVHPGMDSEFTKTFFDAVAKTNKKALIVIGFATGTTPSALNPFIKDLTSKGIPVFILSNNPVNNHGIREIKYETQQESSEAGAIPLRDVNVNNTQEVMTLIQEIVNQGKTGAELSQAVIDKYGTPPKYIPRSQTTQA